MGYTFLEHTADVRARCEAATFRELLETAAGALYDIALTHAPDSARAARHEARIDGAGPEETLVRWLQELIFLLDTESFVACEYAWHEAGPESVRVTLGGGTCEPGDRAEEVKSATYHDLDVSRDEEGFSATITFDL